MKCERHNEVPRIACSSSCSKHSWEKSGDRNSQSNDFLKILSRQFQILCYKYFNRRVFAYEHAKSVPRKEKHF